MLIKHNYINNSRTTRYDFTILYEYKFIIYNILLFVNLKFYGLRRWRQWIFIWLSSRYRILKCCGCARHKITV